MTTIGEFLDAGVADLEERVEQTETIDEGDRYYWFDEWFALVAILARLKTVAGEIEKKLALSIPKGTWVELDGRRWRRGNVPNFRNWKSDDLLRAVLDSRIVDKETGEVVDETPVEKVRAVFGLKGYNASRQELKARGIEADEFAEVEWRTKLREAR
jgi:hypothetical protein